MANWDLTNRPKVVIISLMKLAKPGNFFLFLCVATFLLSLFVVISTKTPEFMNKVKTGEKVDIVSISRETAMDTKFFLAVVSPKDGDILAASSVLVEGKTTPRAEIFVNDTEGLADSAGNFSVKIGLEEGENNITIMANDEVGNYAEKEIAVNVETF